MSMDERLPGRGRMEWQVPVVCVAWGVAYLVVGIVGEDLGSGLFGLVVMVVVAAGVVLLRRRSTTVDQLLDRGDERSRALDLNATAFAGGTVMLAVLIGLMVQLGLGNAPGPFVWLAALGAVAYVAALLFLRVRH